MKKLLSLALIGLALGAVACDQQPTATDLDLTPSFAVWDYKVTGGGEWFVKDDAGERTIFLTISATDFGDEVKGQVEMEKPGAWKIHGVVTCTWFNAEASEGFLGFEVTQLQEDGTNPDWLGAAFGIHVAEDAGPNGEDLGYWSNRDGLDSNNSRSVPYACNNGPAGWVTDNGFPYFPFNGILVDGNLNIRD